MSKKLKIAAYAGILSLVLVPPEIFLEHMLNENPGTQWVFISIVFVYVFSVSCTVFLYYAFFLLGRELDVSAIVISSVIIILLNFIWYSFQVYAIRDPVAFYNLFGGAVLVVFGASRIVFGYGVYRARTALGGLATSLAVLEIVIGLFLITVRLYLVGFVLSLPAAVLQIMLLLGLSRSFDEETRGVVSTD